MTEALDKAEAALAATGGLLATYDASWTVRRLAQHEDALRALITEHRRVLAELDEAHTHFAIQEARIRAADHQAEAPSDDERVARFLAMSSAMSYATALEAVRAMTKLIEQENIAIAARPVVDDAKTDAVAVGIAKAADADYWTDEISEWESSEDWEREAHPDNRPNAAYEDREWYRKQARAAIAALTPDGQEKR